MIWASIPSSMYMHALMPHLEVKLQPSGKQCQEVQAQEDDMGAGLLVTVRGLQRSLVEFCTSLLDRDND